MASKDQRRGHKIVESKVHQTHPPSRMGSQCGDCTQEGWKGKDVHGL